MSEQSKGGKKEALFGEQMGYLHSGVRASVMPKATDTREHLQQLKAGKGKKSVPALASWSSIRGMHYLKESGLAETQPGL